MTLEEMMHIEHLEDRVALVTMHFRVAIKALGKVDIRGSEEIQREHTMAIAGVREKHNRRVDAYRESLKGPVHNPEG